MAKILNKQTRSKRVTGWRRGVKWVVRFFSTASIAVIAYLVLSVFFDTPIEYEIKKSTRLLEEEYAKRNERYDTLNSVLANIIERDKSIYKIIFESEPYSEQEDTHERQIALNERLLTMTNKDMGDEFMERNSQLYQRICAQQGRMESMQKFFAENRDLINTIPSIQPVVNHDLTLLTASFGQRIHPFYKSMSEHNGVDYSVPSGTAVFATADGEVTQIETRGQSHGLSVIIKHGAGYSTFYGHLDRIMVSIRGKVKRGEIIGFSGNTGLSYAPHLHYEVRHNGHPVDPLGYFFMELDLSQMERIRSIARTGMQSLD